MSELNKHILLVMKWLDDKDSVSQDELVENRKSAADAAYDAADAAYDAVDAAYDAADAAADAAYDAADAAYDTAYAAADAAYAAAAAAAYDTAYAEIWVNKYFEISGENKQDYIDAIEAGKSWVIDITIAETVTEWMPRVGEECLGRKFNSKSDSYEECKVVHIDGDSVLALFNAHYTKGLPPKYPHWCESTKPLKTEAEKERDEFIEACYNIYLDLDIIISDDDFTMLATKMFDAGFTAPKGGE